MTEVIPKRLTEERKKKKYSQTDVAKRLNISQSTYAKYETGDRLPDIRTLTKIADIFQTSIDYLVGRYN